MRLHQLDGDNFFFFVSFRIYKKNSFFYETLKKKIFFCSRKWFIRFLCKFSSLNIFNIVSNHFIFKSILRFYKDLNVFNKLVAHIVILQFIIS